MVTVAWAVTDRLDARAALGHARACVAVGGGGLAALTVTGALAVAGRLAGPALVGGNAPTEAVGTIAAAAALAWWAVTGTRRDR